MTVGVAISTYRRPEVLARALANWAQYLPDVLVVNHDTEGDGVAATKNCGITALMDAGCDHLFLADDDVWPISAKWWRYVDDPEPHLMHCWGRRRLQADDHHYTVWSHPRGVLLYTQRHVIDAIGGMRLDFGPRGGGEHVEFSRRIHNAGLTRHRYADLSAAARGVWHCEDYTRSVPSTIGSRQLDATATKRHRLYEKYRGSTDFVAYNDRTWLCAECLEPNKPEWLTCHNCEHPRGRAVEYQ